MNNLHRELAPISDSAWAQIEEEAARTLKRYLAGRRVVDVKDPGGVMLSDSAFDQIKNRSDLETVRLGEFQLLLNQFQDAFRRFAFAYKRAGANCSSHIELSSSSGEV